MSDEKIKKLILVTAFVLLNIICSGFSQNINEKHGYSFEAGVGYSSFFVDPDIDANLSGLTGEIRTRFGEEKLDFVSKNLVEIHELAFSYSQVLKGAIKAHAIGMSYGRRYEFPHWYFSFGVGPFSYWLFSNKKKHAPSGYTLDTGPRLNVFYRTGLKYSIADHMKVTFSLKYNFTIKKIYWHNPFKPHKHEDIFHYLTFEIGILR